MEEELKNWEQFREEVWAFVKKRAAERGLSFQEVALALNEIYAAIAIAAMLYPPNEPSRWDLVCNTNEEEMVQ